MPWRHRTLTSAAGFLAELRTIEASLRDHHGAPLAAQRLHPLIRAVEVFGFHLATVDLRQSSDQHERVVAELLAVAHRAQLHSGLRRTSAAPCCSACCRMPAHRCASWARNTRTQAGELAISRRRLRMRQRYGARPSATTSSATPRP